MSSSEEMILIPKWEYEKLKRNNNRSDTVKEIGHDELLAEAELIKQMHEA